MAQSVNVSEPFAVFEIIVLLIFDFDGLQEIVMMDSKKIITQLNCLQLILISFQ